MLCSCRIRLRGIMLDRRREMIPCTMSLLSLICALREINVKAGQATLRHSPRRASCCEIGMKNSCVIAGHNLGHNPPVKFYNYLSHVRSIMPSYRSTARRVRRDNNNNNNNNHEHVGLLARMAPFVQTTRTSSTPYFNHPHQATRYACMSGSAGGHNMFRNQSVFIPFQSVSRPTSTSPLHAVCSSTHRLPPRAKRPRHVRCPPTVCSVKEMC